MEGIYQVSIIAAFVAGMVALFAPCCISYLLPAYLGNIFKEKKKVLLMTLIYSLGIMVVMLPVVLGARMLSQLFFRLHDYTYIVGGLFMIGVSVLALIGVKLPMPKLSMKQKEGEPDMMSTFTLGVFSGITSSCCAPVLIGVMALSSVSPTTVQALGVGVAYVLGMVSPLYLASLFIEKGNILANPVLKKVLGKVRLGEKVYPIFVSNVVAFFIFLITGLLMVFLSMTGKLGMGVAEMEVTKQINQVALRVTEITGGIPLVNGIFGIGLAVVIYKLINRAIK